MSSKFHGKYLNPVTKPLTVIHFVFSLSLSLCVIE